MRNHRIIRGIQLVIATASFCGALPAQTPKAILTLFQYGPEFHGLKDATVEAKLSDYVSSTLASKFHRPFQSGISTAEPILRVWLRRASVWDLCAAVAAITTPPCDLHENLLTAADMEGLNETFPKGDALIQRVKTSFDRLIETKEDLLRTAFQKMPLGSAFDFVRPIPSGASQVILAKVCLPWNQYSNLGDGYFRTDMSGQNGLVSLYSFGARASEKCAGFDGIRVVVRQWQFGGRMECIARHVSDLPQLTLQAVYLITDEISGNSGLSIANACQ